MIKLSFVILHYQNIEDTVNCIESIKKLEHNSNIDIRIIIVDNNSPNKSGIQLKERYKDCSFIETILMDKNYGFSLSNNKGYQRALNINSDIILVINNDIIFEDSLFINKLEEIYNSETKYDIVCPDIVNINGNHQNPLRDKETTLKKAYKNMIYEFVFMVMMNIPIIRKVLLDKRNKREEKWFKRYYNEKIEFDINNFVPFGAFIIYMNDWIKNEDKAFVSDTFMYCEEDMLSLYIKQNNYKILYEEQLKVKHLEGQSTKKSNKNEYKTMKFKSKNRAKALRKYIKFYKNIKKKRIF